MSTETIRWISPRTAQRLGKLGLSFVLALTLSILLFLLVFVLGRGLEHVTWAFLTEAPHNSGERGGVFPILVGTIAVVLLSVLIAAPLGVGTALYLTEWTSENAFTRAIRFGADCLAGVPSIIFGLFGFVFFVVTLGFGWSILAGALTLALMILPTLIRTAEEAIKAVPRGHRELSLSLGANRLQTILYVVLPAALPGIATGLMLGLGRSISETAAVIFTSGSSLSEVVPTSLFDGTRTLSVHFYQLAREGISDDRAYATASVLVLSIMLINLIAYGLLHRFTRRFR